MSNNHDLKNTMLHYARLRGLSAKAALTPMDVAIQYYGAREVVYDPAWANSTYYFDPAVKVRIESPIWSTDPMGRKLIIIPVLTGENVVLFERYKDNNKTIAFNLPTVRGTRTGKVLYECYPDALRLNGEFTMTDAINTIQAVQAWVL